MITDKIFEKTKKEADKEFLTYKGKPFVRDGNIICYGSMSEKAILFMMIVSYADALDTKIPDRVLIQVLSTDMRLSSHERILKQGEKNGLYDAFDIGCIWLDRELAK